MYANVDVERDLVRKVESKYLDDASLMIANLTRALEEEREMNERMSCIIVEQGEEIEILLKSARTQTQDAFHVRRASGYWSGQIVPPPPPSDEVVEEMEVERLDEKEEER